MGIVDNTSRGFQFDLLACFGFTTLQISGPEISDPSLISGANLYTVTSGGNDVDFTGIVIACVYNPIGPCKGRIQRAKNVINGDRFRNDLNSLYTTLKQNAAARVRFFDTGLSATSCIFRGSSPMDVSTRQALNDLMDLLNLVLRTAAIRRSPLLRECPGNRPAVPGDTELRPELS